METTVNTNIISLLFLLYPVKLQNSTQFSERNNKNIFYIQASKHL
jgi:hypothetical protein